MSDSRDTADDTSEKSTLDQRAEVLFGHAPTIVHLDIGGLSHPGKVRPKNEDHFVVVRRRRMRSVLLSNLPDEFPRQSTEDAYALVVADGMGGQACGELASMLALSVGWDLGGREIKWPHKVSEVEIPEILEKMEIYPRLIQQALKQYIASDPQLRGMGTTFTGVYSVGLEAFLSHIGDSRAYLFREGQLQLLTRDQTLAEDLARSGLVSLESEYLKRASHILTSCLGDTSAAVRPLTAHIHLQYGDRLLLCTDGLSDMVDAESISEILRAGETSDAQCRQLVDRALAQGGRDNITVVLAHYLPAQ